MTQSHRGEILSLNKQLIPISKNTLFHASYDNDLNGFNQGQKVSHFGHRTSLNFDGSTALVNIKNMYADFQNKSFTVETWVYFTNAIAADIPIFTIGFGALDQYLHIVRRNNTAYFGFYGDDLSGIATLSPNTWYHVAFTWDSVTRAKIIYVNGVQDAVVTSTGSLIVPNNSVVVIGSYADGTYWLGGSLSDLRVWDHSRSALQIKENMNLELSGSESGLIGYWKFNEGRGSVTYDSCPRSNEGLISGITKWSEGRIIATLRSDGKFGGSVAVEESTTNLFTNPSIETDLTGISGGYEYTVTRSNDKSYIGDWSVKCVRAINNTNGRAMVMDSNGITAASTTYTISCYVWVDPNTTGTFVNIEDHSGNTTPVSRTEYDMSKKGTWQRVSKTFTTNSIASGPILVLQGSIAGTIGEVLYVDAIQIEQKVFASSFVNGSRSSGALKYDAKNILNTNQGTISCWVYKNPSANLYGNIWSILEDVAGSNTNRFSIERNGNSPNYSIITGNAPSSVEASPAVTIEDYQWIHLVVSWVNGVYNLYKNGNKVFSYTSSKNPVSFNACTLQIGFTTNWSNREFNGLIDELRVDNIAISDDEVLAWYQTNAPFYNYLDYTEVSY